MPNKNKGNTHPHHWFDMSENRKSTLTNIVLAEQTYKRGWKSFDNRDNGVPDIFYAYQHTNRDSGNDYTWNGYRSLDPKVTQIAYEILPYVGAMNSSTDKSWWDSIPKSGSHPEDVAAKDKEWRTEYHRKYKRERSINMPFNAGYSFEDIGPTLGKRYHSDINWRALGGAAYDNRKPRLSTGEVIVGGEIVREGDFLCFNQVEGLLQSLSYIFPQFNEYRINQILMGEEPVIDYQ